MPATYDEPEFSSIEDLDPEPQPKGGRSNTREFLLGLLLVLVVLVWGGWSWAQQESKQTTYREAQQAAANRDWDQARAQYAAAEGYKDANAQLAEIDKLIARRNMSYTAAARDAGRRNWAASLKALQTVNDIQPGYADTKRLQKESEARVYQAAVQGAIALRTQAEPPGLYLRDADGWRWLERSDQWSSVQGSGPPGHVVYDIPGKGWTPARNPSRTPFPYEGTMGSPDLEGRLMAAASYESGTLSVTTLGFDPALYNYYVWGERGVWAVRLNPVAWYDSQVKMLSSYNNTVLAYQRFGSPMTSTLILPGPKWVIADPGSDGEHVLLADLSATNDPNPVSRLYIANGDGTGRRLLYSYEGEFEAAQLSLDSAHALVTTYSPVPGAQRERHAAVLLDVTGNAPPRTLAAGMDPAGSGPDRPAVGATFLREGPHTGSVFLCEWGQTSNTFSLLDPTSPDAPLIKSTLDTAASPDAFVNLTPSGPAWIGYQGADELLLAWQNSTASGRDPPDRLTLLSLSPGKTPQASSHPIDEAALLFGAWVRQDNLIYSTLNFRGVDGTAFSVQALPLSGIDGKQVRAGTIYSATIQTSTSRSWPATWSAGAQMLAYTTGTSLHALTYQGDLDVTLEQGVTDLYDPRRSEGWYWLR